MTDPLDAPYDGIEPERLPVPINPLAWSRRDLEGIGAAIPGVARVVVSAWANTAQWSLLTSWKLTRRLFRAATDPDEAASLAHDLGITVGVVTELAAKVNDGVPLPKALMEIGRNEPPVPATAEAAREDEGARLRARGEALLARSRDVRDTKATHPAYHRILDELAPDEARILVYLYRHGPQPSVDVRTGGPVGMVSSRLIAPGLTMIGGRAGLRYLDEVPAYLNNLNRLGLVWFSRESLGDPGPYQVLEAQPDVLQAMHSVRMPKVVRRSIHLTPFGNDFAATVLAPEDDRAGLPTHGAPPDEDPGDS